MGPDEARRAPELSHRSLDGEGEQAWHRLRKVMELSAGGWFGFVFAASGADVLVLRERVRRTLRMTGGRLLVVEPDDPESLRRALDALATEDARTAAGIWVQALMVGAHEGTSWAEAWEYFLLRLNERRDTVRKNLRGGLVLALPVSLKAAARDAAPDLWSMRTVVVELPGRRTRPGGADTTSEPVPRAVASDKPVAPDSTPTPVTDDVRRELNAIAALLASGQTGTAVARSRELSARTANNPSDLRAALTWLSRAEEADGDLATAGEHADVALSIAGHGDDQELLELSAAAAELDVDLQLLLGRRLALLDLARARADALPGTGTALRDLSISLNDVGEVRREFGDLAEAGAVFEESLAIARRLVAEFGETPTALRDLSVSLNHVGDVYEELGDLAEAGVVFEESLAIARRLVAEFGETPTALRDLSISLNYVGDVRRELGDLAEAGVVFEESLGLRRRLVADLGETPTALRDLSISLDNVGKARRDLGDLDGARGAFEESLAIARRLLVRFGPQENSLVRLRTCFGRLLDIARQQGDAARAASIEEELQFLVRDADQSRADDGDRG